MNSPKKNPSPKTHQPERPTPLQLVHRSLPAGNFSEEVQQLQSALEAMEFRLKSELSLLCAEIKELKEARFANELPAPHPPLPTIPNLKTLELYPYQSNSPSCFVNSIDGFHVVLGFDAPYSEIKKVARLRYQISIYAKCLETKKMITLREVEKPAMDSVDMYVNTYNVLDRGTHRLSVVGTARSIDSDGEWYPAFERSCVLQVE